MDYTFTPSRKIFAAVANALSYVFRNIGNFNDLLKLYLPYMIGAVILIFAGALYRENGEIPGIVMLNYIYLCMTISWFQLLVLGPEGASYTAPFPPSKAVWRILGLITGIIAGIFIVGLIFFGLAKITPPQILRIGLIITFLFGFWFLLRLSLYQVIAAIDSRQTIKDAFALSRSYAGRIFMAGVIMSFILMIFYMIYYFIVALIRLSFSDGSDKFPDTTKEILVYHISELPNYLYIMPLMAVIIATIYANYYLVAIKRIK